MSRARSVAVALVFLVGCAVGGTAGRFAVPPASAQESTGLKHWEYSCFKEWGEEDVANMASKLGQQGWEMAGTGNAGGSDVIWCFKRALP